MQRQSAYPQLNTLQTSIIFLLTLQIIFYCLLTIPLFPNRSIFEKMVGVNILLTSGEWWRFISPIFVHISFHHFLFNSFSLYLFGSMLGERVKDWCILLIFFSSAIFGNLFTYIFAPPAYVHSGASGGVFGFLGVFVSLIIAKRLPKEQAKTIGIMIGLVILFSFFQTDANPYAHIGGFLWGVFFGWMISGKQMIKS
ncbi:rhomboid family intramembrane serine protease [Fervidibacillus halotolerans]|uniref:Rhomboid family intramembrane serine protease n=1 Tax=Fervidibacillus halotolerans TaxID=2980027 RepID=A0A9E8LZQ7_9BACI|nr:rhomboid family intramembrane serine protease [Fervidibacillus halotolerans]WAA12559.1 rhomboid family intramembrane serine protease [Fervidibacillus halotolerans]